MARVRRSGTEPELAVRRALRAIGVGYRLEAADLPGRPDLVMRGRRIAIFVNGCFWHGHEACRRGRTPATNTAFWRERIARNRARDARVLDELADAGWRTVTIWQCETLDETALAERLATTLGLPRD